jgi:hypothetical protein
MVGNEKAVRLFHHRCSYRMGNQDAMAIGECMNRMPSGATVIA